MFVNSMKILSCQITIAILLVLALVFSVKASQKQKPIVSLSLSLKDGLSIIDGSYIKRSQLTAMPTNREKIITWEWDCGGFNNIRMQFEIMFGLSVIYDRTLVLPPVQKWYLMPEDEPCNIQSFYQLDILRSVYPIITAEEWFQKSVTYQEYSDFFREKNQFPDTYRVNATEGRWEKLDDIVKKEDLQSKNTWFFQSCQENYRYRMFGNPDDYFRKSDKLDMIRDCCCRGFKFKQEITSILTKQLHQEDITQIGSYNAVHFRRGDFADSHPHQVNVDMKVYRDVLLRTLDVAIPLLIITNEKDKALFQPITDVFHRVFYLDMSLVPKHQKKWIALLDSLGGVLARKFVGTAESTFSYYIQILRGYVAYYYPSLVSDKMFFLQEQRGREVVKVSSEWQCQQGCWAINDQDHWRFLASQRPMKPRKLIQKTH